MQTLLHDGDEHVDRDRYPDLRLHRVLRGAEEPLDPQVLLDPLEEQFDLPTAFVEGADRGGGQRALVGDEDERLACLGVLEADAPHLLGVARTAVVAGDDDGLVADDAVGAVGGCRVDAACDHVLARADDAA